MHVGNNSFSDRGLIVAFQQGSQWGNEKRKSVGFSCGEPAKAEKPVPPPNGERRREGRIGRKKGNDDAGSVVGSGGGNIAE